MSTPLKKIVDAELNASGMASEQLNHEDAEYVAGKMKGVLSSLKARRVWEKRIGAILTHQQTVELVGWTKQALSQAVRDGRVLRLKSSDGSTLGYWSEGFTDDAPHRPIRGIGEVVKAWAAADVDTWMISSWMSSSQVELGGRTPRQTLIDGETDLVVQAAQQAAWRIAS